MKDSDALKRIAKELDDLERMDKEDQEKIRKSFYEDLTKFDIDILRILSRDLLITGKGESIAVRATKEHMDALVRLIILGFAELKKRENGKYLLKVSKSGKRFLEDTEQGADFED
ncbi:MAG: hypothetical protein ACFFBS_02765 [Promethearchaeota archaeon]